MWDEIKLPRYFPDVASYVPNGRQSGQMDSVRAIGGNEDLWSMPFCAGALVKVAISIILPDCDSMRQTALSYLRRLELCSVCLCSAYDGIQLQTWWDRVGAQDGLSLC